MCVFVKHPPGCVENRVHRRFLQAEKSFASK